MRETPQSPEQGRPIKSIKQLKAEYPIFNIWPTTDNKEEIRKRMEAAEQEAQKIIEKNGGLTEDEAHSLDFYKEGEDIHNDI